MSRRRRARRPAPTTDQRSPEVRLEAMVREPNPERAHRTFGRILDDLEAKPEPGPWIDAARTLSERLIISEDAFYYMVEMFTEPLLFTASHDDAQLARISSEMQAIERAHGLAEDESWLISEAPEDWRRLNDEWEHRADKIVESSLRETGHSDVAELRAKDRDEFDGRVAQGQRELWGDDDEADDDAISAL